MRVSSTCSAGALRFLGMAAAFAKTTAMPQQHPDNMAGARTTRGMARPYIKNLLEILNGAALQPRKVLTQPFRVRLLTG